MFTDISDDVLAIFEERSISRGFGEEVPYRDFSQSLEAPTEDRTPGCIELHTMRFRETQANIGFRVAYFDDAPVRRRDRHVKTPARKAYKRLSDRICTARKIRERILANDLPASVTDPTRRGRKPSLWFEVGQSLGIDLRTRFGHSASRRKTSGGGGI